MLPILAQAAKGQGNAAGVTFSWLSSSVTAAAEIPQVPHLYTLVITMPTAYRGSRQSPADLPLVSAAATLHCQGCWCRFWRMRPRPGQCCWRCLLLAQQQHGSSCRDLSGACPLHKRM